MNRKAVNHTHCTGCNSFFQVWMENSGYPVGPDGRDTISRALKTCS